MIVLVWTLATVLAPGGAAPPPAAPPDTKGVAAPEAAGMPEPVVPPEPAATNELVRTSEPVATPAAEAPPTVAPAKSPEPSEVVAPGPVPPAKAIPEDRVELRDGGMIIGRVVAVQKGSHVTIVVSQTGQSRTVGWALIDAYRVGDGPEQIASRGKPTIAELAATSDSIEQQKNIGLGLAYGGYISGALSLSLWGATGISIHAEDGRPEPLLVAAVASTAVTVGLLVGGGVLFFKSQQRRRDLRKIQISGGWLPGGGGLELQGRF